MVSCLVGFTCWFVFCWWFVFSDFVGCVECLELITWILCVVGWFAGFALCLCILGCC